MSYVLVKNILGSLLLTYLLRGELSFLSEAEASKIEANTDHLTGLLNRRGLDMIYLKFADYDGKNRGWALLYRHERVKAYCPAMPHLGRRMRD
jgi:hypothetical protein